ncbi:DUF4190 domain-containing protein [Streptomyces sp. NBC_00893]|uniref:DUF4190 domain-containing protein n=1 Tax=Streptomyces sp. NBC_00893 TaxID=2975862 RepID=UPI00224D2F64|nr:DUF4190 domain-containing protein [Streptomyces sp. NBC_00893]MCX4845039.1 DUF4190 domain-containing protein [Streptomyces sp. NBC_00893]
MTLTASVHRPETDDRTTAVAAEPVATAGAESDDRSARTRDADGLAVASFVLGLVGLLVMNILFGPAAIVMAILALVRSTSRRGRACLGLVLGIADLVVLACLVTGNGVVAWNFGG